jgi:hypothetical protein
MEVIMKEFGRDEMFPNKKPTRISVYDYDEYNHSIKHTGCYKYVAMFDNAATIVGNLLLVKNEQYPDGFLTVNNSACGPDRPYGDRPPVYLVRLPFTFEILILKEKLLPRTQRLQNLIKKFLTRKSVILLTKEY